MVTIRSHILLFSVVLLLLGCSGQEQIASQSLVLSLDDSGKKLKVVDYEVRNKPFVKSQQQGRYQAHLFAGRDTILQRINFDKIDLSIGNDQNKEIHFFVSLPLMPEAERIEIYQLDGRSGHYQLKTDTPLLDWPIPQNIE